MQEMMPIKGIFSDIDDNWPKNVVVIGAGGFGREIAEICKCQYLHSRDVRFIGYLDDDESLHGKEFNGDEVLGGIVHSINYASGIKGKVYFACGLGEPKLRKEVTERVLKLGYKPITLIHPSVVIGTGVKIGEGVVIQAGSSLAINCRLENHIHLNYNCIVGHDAIVEDYTTFAPSVQVMGNSHISTGVYLGLNSVVLQGIKVGSNSIIGALAMVNKNVPSNITVVGCPAKPLKRK